MSKRHSPLLTGIHHKNVALRIDAADMTCNRLSPPTMPKKDADAPLSFLRSSEEVLPEMPRAPQLQRKFPTQ